MRVAFLGCLAFIGAVAVFLGAVVMLTSWQTGTIEISYSESGKIVTEKVARALNGARFWQLYGMMGLAPAVLGAIAVMFGVRGLRQPPAE